MRWTRVYLECTTENPPYVFDTSFRNLGSSSNLTVPKDLIELDFHAFYFWRAVEIPKDRLRYRFPCTKEDDTFLWNRYKVVTPLSRGKISEPRERNKSCWSSPPVGHITGHAGRTRRAGVRRVSLRYAWSAFSWASDSLVHICAANRFAWEGIA